jgi:hypothetical protein
MLQAIKSDAKIQALAARAANVAARGARVKDCRQSRATYTGERRF